MPGRFNLHIDMYEWEIIDRIPSNDDCSSRTNKQRWVRLAAARGFCHSRLCGLGLAAWPGLQLLDLGFRVWGLNKQLVDVRSQPCPAQPCPAASVFPVCSNITARAGRQNRAASFVSPSRGRGALAGPHSRAAGHRTGTGERVLRNRKTRVKLTLACRC